MFITSQRAATYDEFHMWLLSVSVCGIYQKSGLTPSGRCICSFAWQILKKFCFPVGKFKIKSHTAEIDMHFLLIMDGFRKRHLLLDSVRIQWYGPVTFPEDYLLFLKTAVCRYHRKCTRRKVCPVRKQPVPHFQEACILLLTSQ